MTTSFEKLDKFERHDFRRWQKKMHFLLTTLKVVYVLTTLMLELLEDATVEAIRIRSKWKNDDYICRGHILNEDSSSKKIHVSNFNNYKMVAFRAVMEQYNELLRILGQYTQHGLKMDESIFVSSIIDKLPPSWKDFKHTLKHEVDGTSVNMIEEGKNKNNKQNKGKKHNFKEHDSGSGSNKKPKLEFWKCGKTGHFKRDYRSGDKKNANAGGSGKGLMQLRSGLIPVLQLMFVKIVAGLRHSVYMSSFTVVNSSLWHARLGDVHYKRMLEMSKDDLIPAIDENLEKCTTCLGEGFWGEAMLTVCYLLKKGCRAVVRLPDPKRKTLGEKGIYCIFFGYAEHSKAY
nr:hypothetical protein [Tanacetum cinerariifolium]